MNNRAGLLLLFLFLIIAPSAADIMLPGYKYVSYCLEISNAGDFPDYIFIAYPTIVGDGFVEVTPGNCVGYYKLATPVLYAIRRADFNATAASEDHGYLKNNSQLISSGLTLPNGGGAVPLFESLSGTEEVYKIISLNSTGFEIRKVETTVRYEGGSSETIVEPPEAANESSPRSTVSPGLEGEYAGLEVPALFISGLAGIGIITELFIRRKAK